MTAASNAWKGEDGLLFYSDELVKEAGTFGSGARHLKGGTMKYSHTEHRGAGHSPADGSNSCTHCGVWPL